MNQIEVAEDVKEIRISLSPPREIKIIGQKTNGNKKDYKLRVTRKEKLEVI